MSSDRLRTAFDVTHMVSRLIVNEPTGIDRIDLAFARHFIRPDVSGASADFSGGVHYGNRHERLHSPAQTAKILELAEQFWQEKPNAADDAPFNRLRAWLASTPGAPFEKLDVTKPERSWLYGKYRSLRMTQLRLAQNRSVQIPQGAIYLNIAQHQLENPWRLTWLDRRPDLRKVFFIFDLLSIDYPEYFRPDNYDLFRRRLATALHHADAFLVSAQSVKTRLEEEMRALGQRPRPIHVGYFPSPLTLDDNQPATALPERSATDHPYFIIVGTIEPRKNHLLLLQLWREMVHENPNAPRLLIVGGRGWECEQVIDLLDRSPVLRSHVAEVSAVPSAQLNRLVHGAQALLMPTFDEGYGLPVVEALSMGTPAIASDIPVFREIMQDCAILRSPLDGPGWKSAILQIADRQSDFHRDARARAARFVAPTWPKYFADVEAFLSTL